MSVSEARAALTDVVNRVLAGEEITLTRHGQAVAVVVRPDALRTRRAGDALAVASRVRDTLDAGATRRLRPRPRVSKARADQLVADVRASRARR